MPVPVDVIRVAFWMEDLINLAERKATGGGVQRKFKIPMGAIEIQNDRCGDSRLGCPSSEARRSRSVVRLLQLRGELPQQCHECRRGHRQSAVPPVGQSKFAVQFRILQINQLDPAGIHFVAGERRADQRHSQIGGHEALDHADARQFHPHLQFRAVGPE